MLIIIKFLEGCGFVKYSSRESAMAAINSLSGSYIMRVSFTVHLFICHWSYY